MRNALIMAARIPGVCLLCAIVAGLPAGAQQPAAERQPRPGDAAAACHATAGHDEPQPPRRRLLHRW